MEREKEDVAPAQCSAGVMCPTAGPAAAMAQGGAVPPPAAAVRRKRRWPQSVVGHEERGGW